MNSPAWPPSPASLSGDQSSADSLQRGWRAGWTLETRCHLSLEHQGTKHLSPTSPHAQELQAEGVWACKNLSCFSQTPFRAEQDARKSELEGLQRKLASTGGEGMSRLWCCVAQSNTFPTSTELAVLKQTMSQSRCLSAVTDSCKPTIHRTDACVSHNPEDTWGHTPPGLQIFPGRTTPG